MASIGEQKIDQLITEKESEKVKEEIQTIEFKELKKQAIDFLTQINKYKQGFFHHATFQQIYGAFKADLGKKTNQSFMQQCFVQAEKLEDKLNHFLGREIFFTWVNTKGEILFYDNIAAQDIHGELRSSGVNNAKGQYRVPDRDKRIKEFQYDLLNEMKERVEEKTADRATVYKTAITRHRQKSRKEDPDNGMAYKNKDAYKNTFWWRTKTWPLLHWYTDSSQKKSYGEGHIAQAYALGVLNNARNFNNLKDLDISLQTLYKLINVDQVAAILKGDIKLKEDGRFQFQVKSPGSSSAAIGQYIALAYYIIFQKDLSVKELQKKITQSLHRKHNQAHLILMDLFDYSLNELKEKWEEIDNQVYLQLGL